MKHFEPDEWVKEMLRLCPGVNNDKSAWRWWRRIAINRTASNLSLYLYYVQLYKIKNKIKISNSKNQI